MHKLADLMLIFNALTTKKPFMIVIFVGSSVTFYNVYRHT